MNEQKLIDDFYDIQSKVYKICIYEEFTTEMKKMSESNFKDISTKLRLILLNKKIHEAEKKELENFISDIEKILPQGIDLSTFDTMINQMKNEANTEISNILLKINYSRYEIFNPLMNLLDYALELNIPLFDFVKVINIYGNFMSELEDKETVIKLDSKVMYRALKNVKSSKKNLSRT